MYLKSLKYMLAAFLMAFANAALSDCACFCADGELQTMCSDVTEAQADPVACSPLLAQSCPEESRAEAGQKYTSPQSGAVNCRDVRVFDSRRGQFVTIKACDVLESG